ncbi:hypothetical protein [Butyricicoccus pullicaecorum]|uniref:Uncharacterized protein n=1 Tax=Butyricicoccus pullicaecorum 1.2 TaxID=1203606 RepID=R8VSP4_9FIRM|nr:hypothetical protein [Butyricicoccus pullicaecorum]EOQ35795.1 hypothetical protein HMPREF1526_02594 [Butyricicoccus pullicaecorum 1.2]SKA67850.1 hypothetical protein SAMN02745978_03035 [Butyricicoccus pullicaecorum DSM 23266]
MKRMKQYLIYFALAVAVVLFVLSVVLHVLPDWYVWLSGALIFLTSAEKIWRVQKKWSVGMVAICAVAVLSLFVFLKHLLGL